MKFLGAMSTCAMIFSNRGGYTPNEETIDKAVVLFDKVESKVTDFWQWSRVHRGGLKALSGLGLLLYGGKVPLEIAIINI